MALLSHTQRENDSPNTLKAALRGLGGSMGAWGLHFGFISYITLFDLYMITFAAGIMLYFTLSFETPLAYAGVLYMACLAVLFLLRKQTRRYKLRQMIMFLAVGAFGLLSAAFHTQSQRSVFLPDYDRAYDVTGWVEGQDQGRTGPRWMIRVTVLEGYDTPPKRIRIRGKGDGLQIGDFIQTRAVLKGPLYPATPHGYNARRAAYFQGLAASGFAVKSLENIENIHTSTRQNWARSWAQIRYKLAARIESQSPKNTAGLQAALITGLRRGISEDHVTALRASGLAHILAISGLHMAIFAGSFYSLMAWGFACIPAFARSRDVRKYAAFAGILAASFYLLISGASVATQRAYIMAVILFLAVMLDRQALSTRSVSIAAFITLILHPESLLSVGFQMSFAAVLALVIVYRHWSDWKSRQGWVFTGSLILRIRNGFVSLSVTSFVAGAATGLFAVMQFQRWAKYGLLGNLAAMPVFTLLVMPMALATFLLLPFGQEYLSLWVMGKGLEQVLWVAGHIETLPKAMFAVKKPPAGYVGLYAACFLMVCIGRRGLISTGLLFGGILAVLWIKSAVPVMRVSTNGYVTWQSDEGAYYTLNRRADHFGRGQFLQQNGHPNADVESAARLEYCDSRGCLLRIKGKKIAIIETPDLLPEACETAELIILQKRQAGPRSKYLCSAKIIDPETLKQSGAVDIYAEPNGWRLETTRITVRNNNAKPNKAQNQLLPQLNRHPWD